MTGEIPGLPPAQHQTRPRTRCADPLCHRPVYVDQLVAGFGRCCAENRGLIVIRHRIAARPQHGPTLLDQLPGRTLMEAFPQVRIDVTDLAPRAAHTKIVEHARSMISDPSGEIAAAYPHGITAATDAAFRGLVDILERHAPMDYGTMGAGCQHHGHPGAGEAWPCDDYRAAAAGLATGLPGADR